MASLWSNSIPRSKKLDEGLNLLRLVSLETFHSVLDKIQSKEMFSDNDIENLMEKQNISDIQSRHIIETISFMYKHLSKVILKPKDLKMVMIKNFNIEEDKAHLWIKMWTEDIGRNFSLANMNELQNVSWELNLQAASTLFRKEAVPNATIQLKGSNDNTVLHLDEEELVYLFNNLENIQTKLDMYTSNIKD